MSHSVEINLTCLVYITKQRMNPSSDAIPSHNVDEMKAAVVQYSMIKKELNQLQQQSKAMRVRRDALYEKMKVFMRYNQLELCHISDSVKTDIRKIRYFQRDKKQRVTIKMIEENFADFFDSIDIQKFIALSNKEKSEAFFDFLDRKRPLKTLDCIIIR